MRGGEDSGQEDIDKNEDWQPTEESSSSNDDEELGAIETERIYFLMVKDFLLQTWW